MISLMYYFGVLTIQNVSMLGKPVQRIPSLVIRGLYVERLKRQVLQDPQDDITAKHLAEKFYQDDGLQPRLTSQRSVATTDFSR